MQKITVAASYKEKSGKGVARKLRAAGHVPAVIYGKDCTNNSISVKKTDIRPVFKGRHGSILVSLNLPDNATRNVILKDVQLNPITDEVLHIDFMEVSMERPITLKLDLVLEGTPRGVKEGGIFSHGVREVLIKALPSDMPEYFAVDVSSIDIGQSIHINDLPSSDKVKVISKNNVLVASVAGAQVNTNIAEGEAEEAEVSV